MTTHTIPAAGQFGYIADAVSQELPENGWSYAQNMRFRNGYAERFRGDSPVFTAPTVTPYWITSYRNQTSKFWIHAGTARVFVDDGVTRTDLTPTTAYTGAVDDRWTGGSASGVMVINNGVDIPQFWGGNVAAKFAPLTGWNAAWRCASMRPFKQYLIALDVTKSGTRFQNMVKWSAAAAPGTLPASWDETDAAKDAGETDIAETTDVLLDQLQLGDINVIYKERSMYAMQYIGPPYIWRFYRLPGDVGMLARGCAVNTPKGHVVLTAGDVVLHTGQGPQSIVDGRMRRWLFGGLDANNYGRSFVVANYPTNEVWICFPQQGQASCTQALVWNWQDDTLGVRDLDKVTYGASGQLSYSPMSIWSTDAGTWDADTTNWNTEGFGSTQSRLILSATTPVLSLAETGGQIGSLSPTCTLERSGMAFDAPDAVKTVRSIVPRVDAAQGTVLSFQVGASMSAENAPLWSAPVTYVVGTTRKVDSFATGRFLSIRASSNSAQPWRIKSYDVDVSVHGAY